MIVRYIFLLLLVWPAVIFGNTGPLGEFNYENLQVYFAGVIYCPPIPAPVPDAKPLPANWLAVFSFYNSSEVKKYDPSWSTLITKSYILDEFNNKYNGKINVFVMRPPSDNTPLYPDEEINLAIRFDPPVAKANKFRIILALSEGLGVSIKNPVFPFGRDAVKYK